MKASHMITSALVLNGLGLWACAGAIVYTSGHATVLVSTPPRAPFVIDSGVGGLQVSLDGSVDTSVDLSTSGTLDLNLNTSGAALDVNLKSP
jgi:hypothetical protein